MEHNSLIQRLKYFFKKKKAVPHENLTLPKHIAIIMDGNGRWAKNKHLPVAAGHAKGIKAAWNTIINCVDLNIEALTLYVFSLENWQRDSSETATIIRLAFTDMDTLVDKLKKRNVKISFMGDVSKLSSDQQNKLKLYEHITSQNTGLKLNLATSYSGQWDIVQAVNKIIGKIKTKELPEENISLETFQSFLCFADSPAPDLFIRTGGDCRISNFLLWQMAYTELYFTSVLWPDFNFNELNKALNEFGSRERRFGKRLPEQSND